MMEHEERCIHLTTAAKAVRGTNPLHDTFESITEAIDAADCCREIELFDIASELLELATKFPIAADPALKARMDQQREMIANRVTSVLPEHIEKPAVDLPPIWIRGWNFAAAMARHALNGGKLCPQEKIDERLAICQACPHISESQHCSKCGCPLNADNQIMNKLALESEKCPIGSW